MKKLLFIIVLIAMTAFTMGADSCVEETADDKQAAKTEMIQDRLNSKLGLPNVINGQEKRLMKELYEMRDQADLMTFTYTYNEMTGEHRYLGRSVGFGLPASVQYSNPEKEMYARKGGYGTLPQAEPNGLFMPEGLSATWVYLVNPATNEAVPTYVEPTITVSLFPLPNASYPVGGEQYRDLIK